MTSFTSSVFICVLIVSMSSLVLTGPPTPDIIAPIVYIKQSSYINTNGPVFIIKGDPKPTFTGMKVTSQGLVDLPIGVQIKTQTEGFRLSFINYTDTEYGTYLIKAENKHGEFTANLTFRGLIANPTNLIAWSTSPNSIHLKFRAGEIFNVEVYYSIFNWIDGKTPVQKYRAKDIGETITVTITSLDPGVTYTFYVRAEHPKYGYSFYSNAVTVATIKQGDPSQQEPVQEPVPATTDSTCSTTSSKGSEKLGFSAGIGVGLGIGILVAIAAAILAVVCFKLNINHGGRNHTTFN